MSWFISYPSLASRSRNSVDGKRLGHHLVAHDACLGICKIGPWAALRVPNDLLAAGWDDGGSWLKIGWNWKQRWKKSQSGNCEVETPNFLQNFWRNWSQATESVTTVSNFKLLVIIHRVIGGNWAISPIFFQWLVADHFLAQPRPLHRDKIEALSTRRDPKSWPKWLWVKTLGDPTRSIVGQRIPQVW